VRKIEAGGHKMNKKEITVEEGIRGEYLEMPGLHLSDSQAERLLATDSKTCRKVLKKLIDEGFLRKTKNGYTRSQVS
jgi:hypothetical protein